MRTFKMIVEYDGTGYHGWQQQKRRPTIQQTLEEMIGIIANEKTMLRELFAGLRLGS